MSAIYIPSTYATEVFVDEDNLLVISQEIPDDTQPRVIVLSKEQAQMIYKHLRDSHYII